VDEFRTIAKLWPAGTELDLGIDSSVLTLTPPDSANFARTAAPFVTSPDGTQTYQFLFWNTGRHMTNKRKVTWIFRRFGWGIWTATRWYGTPGGGPGGPPRVHADAFSVGGNALLSSDSPIDGDASSFAAGAWPFNGDDHAIGTANGAATVVAKEHLGAYDFGGWMKLLWGGDPTGEFQETDDDTTGNFGTSSFFQAIPAAGNAYSAAQNENVDLLAGYVPQPVTPPGRGFPPDRWRWLEELAHEFGGDRPEIIGDPSPIDLIRLAGVADLLRRTQPDEIRRGDFESLIAAAPRMGKEELTRAKQSVQTTLELGKSALRMIDARLKSHPG
jgi:hypothetical protein